MNTEDGLLPWYLADGTDAFWHPKAVYPFGSSAGTTTAAASVFADKTALVGQNKQGAKVWVEFAAGPTGSALVIRADIYQHDETTLIAQQIIGNSLVPVAPAIGPIQIVSGVHGASAGSTTGGFCVKLINLATGNSPADTLYKCRVYYTLDARLGG